MIEVIKNTFLQEGNYVAPGIKIVDNVLDCCEEVVDLALSKDSGWESSVIGSSPNNPIEDVRNSKEMQIGFGLNFPKEFFILHQTVYLYARHYSYENNFDFSHMENISILRYKQFDGFYSSHIDSGPMMPRSMSALLYLNNVEDGGETHFDKFNVSITPKAGRLALFPASYPYSHAANPPKSGEKIVAVTWFGMQIFDDVFEKYYGK